MIVTLLDDRHTAARRGLLALIGSLATLAAIVAMRLPEVGSGSMSALIYLDLLFPVGGLIGCMAYLEKYREGMMAPYGAGMLGVGVYALLLGATFLLLMRDWLWTASAGVGMLLVAGLLILLSVMLVLTGWEVLGEGGRRVRALWHPLALAGGAWLLTLAVLLLRGPSDWTAPSGTLTLYGVPVMVLAGILAVTIIDLSRPVWTAVRDATPPATGACRTALQD